MWNTIHVVDSVVAFRLTPDGLRWNPTSFTLQDTLLQNVKTGVLVLPLENGDTGSPVTPSIHLENLGLRFCDKTVADTNDKVLLAGSSGGSMRSWVLGPTYKNAVRTWTNGNASEYPREESLLFDGGQAGPPMRKYLYYSYQPFESSHASDFVSIKAYGAKGKIYF